MNKALISFAIPEDVEQIREVQKEVWLATYPNEANGITTKAIEAQFTDKEKTSQWISQVKQALLEGSSRGWIARVEDKIVGYCFVRKMEDKNRIMSIYVLPQFQKQGIGKALMEKMLEVIDKTKPIVLEVASYNANAIQFYKSFGFVDNGITQNEVAALQTGIVVPEIEMIRKHV